MASGEDFEKVTELCMKFFAKTHGKGKDFRFLDWYTLLENLPKWAETDVEKEKAGKSRCTKKLKKEKKLKSKHTIGKCQQALNDKAAKVAEQIGIVVTR